MPKKALTAASVQRIRPPSSGQAEYFDKGYPGLALRVSYGGGRSFVFFYRLGGKLRRLTLGQFPSTSLADAREAWRSAREDVVAGRDPAKSRNRSGTATDFKSVSDEWLKRDQSDNKSKKEVERVLNREILPTWEHREVSTITKRDVIQLIEAIADRGTPIMARRTLAYIHRFFKWAISRDIGVENNPAAGVAKPGQETKRDRVLTDKELRAIWKGAEKIGWPWADAIKLLILTGARREEIGQLRWSEIVEDQIRLKGARTKNGQPHNIPLSKPALAIISDLPRINGDADLVFTVTGRTPISGWSKAKIELNAAAPSEAWRIHDLRRTVATGLQRLGVTLQTIEAVLGHVSGSRGGVVGVYQRHSFDAEKGAALDAWGQHVSETVR